MDTESNQSLTDAVQRSRPVSSQMMPNSLLPDERVREAFAASGFFPRHRAAVEMDMLKWPREDLLAKAWLRLKYGGAVALIGPRGTGKTQMAASLAHERLRHVGGSCQYTRAQDYFGAIKRSFDGEENDPRRKARNVGLLVLDEVQERYESAFEDLELTSLLDHRYGHERPTILIANLTPDEFAKSLGTSIVSRIQETGITVVCDWPSFRTHPHPTEGTR